jgi:hypothetical protein
MDDKSATQMTSSEFVSFAAHVSRHVRSWDEASAEFPGRPRWEGPDEVEMSAARIPSATSAAGPSQSG